MARRARCRGWPRRARSSRSAKRSSSRDDLPRVEHGRSRGSQLDRQRQVIESPAELGRVGIVHRNAGALGEEPDGVGTRQRGDVDDVLGRQSQRLATRRYHWASERIGNVGGCVEQVLAAVEQHARRCELVDDRRCHRLAGHRRNPRGGDGFPYVLRARHGGEVDPDDLCPERGDRQPRLAHSTGAGEGHNAVGIHGLAHNLELSLATDEGGAGPGHSAPRADSAAVQHRTLGSDELRPRIEAQLVGP
jgi:hypothetical protein